MYVRDKGSIQDKLSLKPKVSNCRRSRSTQPLLEAMVARSGLPNPTQETLNFPRGSQKARAKAGGSPDAEYVCHRRYQNP